MQRRERRISWHAPSAPGVSDPFSIQARPVRAWPAARPGYPPAAVVRPGSRLASSTFLDPRASGPERGQRSVPASRWRPLFGPDRDWPRVNHSRSRHVRSRAWPTPARPGVPPAAVVRPGSRLASRRHLSIQARLVRAWPAARPGYPPTAVVRSGSRLASSTFLDPRASGPSVANVRPGVAPAAVVWTGSRLASRQPFSIQARPVRAWPAARPGVPPAAVVWTGSRLASRQPFLHTLRRSF
jgi:hypothetical protein